MSVFSLRGLAAGALPAAACLCSSLSNAQTLVGNVAPEVVVSATRFPSDPRSLPFGVTQISRQEIEASGARTINEALTRLAGVQARLDFFGGSNTGLDLRGFGITADSNQLIIVDGIRLTEQDSVTARLSAIPIGQVESIEILRGSGAVLYGEGATGGVILISTSSGGQQKGPQGQVSITGGSNQTRGVAASANKALASPSGSLILKAFGQRELSANHRVNLASEEQSLGAAVEWLDGLNALGLRYSEDTLHSGLPGPLTFQQFQTNPRQAASVTDHADIRSRYVSLNGKGRVSQWDLDLQYGSRNKAYDSINGSYVASYIVDSTSYSIGARTTTDLGWSVGRWQVGVEGQQWVRTGLAGVSGARGDLLGVHGRAEFTLESGTQLSAGVREQSVERTSGSAVLSERKPAHELGISVPLSDGLTGYARSGSSFRWANVDELGFVVPGVGLQVQSSKDKEIGARWVNSQHRVEFRVYQSNLVNEIGYDPNASGPFGFPGANVNFDPTRRQGLELEGSSEITSGWRVYGAAAWRSATFQSGVYVGRHVPLVPEVTASALLQWLPQQGKDVRAGLIWNSAQYPTMDNACRMPSFATLQLGYRQRIRSIDLSLDIDNATDKRYFTQAFACSGATATSLYPEKGRTARITASLPF